MPSAMAGKRLVPPGLDFAGRPQLIASVAGRGGGRSLVFNGHIDVVSAEPVSEWASDPFVASVRDGLLYGRGACDMKGGIAAMVFAVEVLSGLGIGLSGDLLVATEYGRGVLGGGRDRARRAWAFRRRRSGDRADGLPGVDLLPRVGVRGRSGAGPSGPRRGPAARLAVGWRRQRDREGGRGAGRSFLVAACLGIAPQLSHSLLSPPSLLATMARAGEWAVTYPASCDLTIAVMYLPAQADASGWGSDVRPRSRIGSRESARRMNGCGSIRRRSSGGRTR